MPAETVRWISFSVGALALLAATGLLLWRMFHRQPSPEEAERLRRDALLGAGKIGDCEITDVDGAIITYTYPVSGVIYTVAQDASALARLLPQDRMLMVGPASVRYDNRNPYNSMVICEAWSGIRARPTAAREDRVPLRWENESMPYQVRVSVSCLSWRSHAKADVVLREKSSECAKRR
jgi:hypothetical protein